VVAKTSLIAVEPTEIVADSSFVTSEEDKLKSGLDGILSPAQKAAFISALKQDGLVQ